MECHSQHETIRDVDCRIHYQTLVRTLSSHGAWVCTLFVLPDNRSCKKGLKKPNPESLTSLIAYKHSNEHYSEAIGRHTAFLLDYAHGITDRQLARDPRLGSDNPCLICDEDVEYLIVLDTQEFPGIHNGVFVTQSAACAEQTETGAMSASKNKATKGDAVSDEGSDGEGDYLEMAVSQRSKDKSVSKPV